MSGTNPPRGPPAAEPAPPWANLTAPAAQNPPPQPPPPWATAAAPPYAVYPHPGQVPLMQLPPGYPPPLQFVAGHPQPLLWAIPPPLAIPPPVEESSSDEEDEVDDDFLASGALPPATPRASVTRHVKVRLKIDGSSVQENDNELLPIPCALTGSRVTGAPLGGNRWGAIGQPAAAPIARQNLASMDTSERNKACVQALERYVVACGGSADLVKGWTATVETRKEGGTAGTYDVYYFDTSGKRFRSRAEVARAFYLAVPQRRTKVTAGASFGRTKKGRRRTAHAKRFAACTLHLRAALGRVLDDEVEDISPSVLAKQNAEADDRGARAVAAGASRAERLLQKLEESRAKETAARERLLQAKHALSESSPPEASEELVAAVHAAEIQAPGSVPIHETDLQLAYKIEQYQQARASHEAITKEAERERRGVDRLSTATLKLEELYQEARLAAEKRAAQEEERKKKRSAKQRDALLKQEERKRAPKRAPRKSAVAKEPSRRKKKYPIDDALLVHEPDLGLPSRPEPTDPCAELLRGLPPDKVGDVLAIHALLKAVAARRTAQGLKRGRPSTGLDLEEAPNQPPPLQAFAAALASPLKTLPGTRGALEPLRRAHSCLLEVLLDDASADDYWLAVHDKKDPGFFGVDSDDEPDSAERATKLRARQHPWARVARRFARAATQRLSEDPPDPEEAPSERIWDVHRATEAVIRELQSGVEENADTRRWVSACEQVSSDALRCAARFTTMRSARTLLEHLSSLANDERSQGALGLASAAREARPKCWVGAAADRDTARREDAEKAAQTWAGHLASMPATTHKAREETRRARAEGWRVEGSQYLGRTVRRSVLDASGQATLHSDGTVRGWLDASRSDYADGSGKPAALWHVYFSTGDLEGDEEDLELNELVASLVPKNDDTDDDEPVSLPKVPRAKPIVEEEKTKDRRRGRKAKKTILEEYGEERERILDKLGGSKQAPFPRDQVHEALVLDARDRAAAKKRLREEDAPPPPEYDPFEDHLDAPPPLPPPAPLRLPRPPQQAVGPRTWACLAGAVGARLAQRDEAPQALHRAAKWLSEGYPYGGLGTRERVAILKALCDAYASSYGCATLVDEAAEQRALRDAKLEADERDRKRRVAEKERETASLVRGKLSAELATLPPEELNKLVPAEKKPRKKAQKAPKAPDLDERGRPRKRPRPRPGAAAPPLSALLDHFITCDAPCLVDQRNPKLPGSRCHALYEGYRQGTTIKQVMRLGGRRGDIFNDLARGYSILQTPLHARQYAAARLLSEEDAIPDFAAYCVGDDAPVVEPEVEVTPPETSSPTLATVQPTRHRFRAEIAHARAVDACGGGDVEFVASIPALERREAALGLEARTERLREARRLCVIALRKSSEPGAHGIDVQSLRDAVAKARSTEVLLEGVEEPEEEEPEPVKGENDPVVGWTRRCEPRKSSDKVDVYYFPPDGVQLRSRPDVRRYFEGKPEMAEVEGRILDPQVDFCFSEEPVVKTLKIEPKRWVCREVAAACEALRDAEGKLDDIGRRRAKGRDARARALPRLEPLGFDRDNNAYWLFPRRDTLEIESVPRPRPASPLRVWVETRGTGAPSWKFHDASAIQSLADSLDGRGARERALKDALADHLPVFGLDDCDD